MVTPLAALLLALALPAQEPSARIDEARARALLKTYCFDCHGEGSRKGGVALDALLGAPAGPDAAAGWQRAWKILRHGFMPPAGKDAPTAAERRALVVWMAAARLGVDLDAPDPGRVTIRRLNRMEYEYSVQDLFGVDLADVPDFSSDLGGDGNGSLRLRDRLPPDETAFGFDNNGDFLSLSPALLERFVDLADRVLRRVVALDGPRPPERSYPPARFASAPPAEDGRGEQSLALEVPKDGLYRVELRFRVGGWQEYGGAYEVRTAVDDAPLAAIDLEVGGYKSHVLAGELRLSAGQRRLSISTSPRQADAEGKRRRLDLKPLARLVGPLGPEHLAYPEPHRRVFFRGDAPADAAGRAAYAREILERVATRAYRGPVGAESLDALAGLARQGASFEAGIARALTAVLASPRFLYRMEAQPRPDDPAAVHPLDEHALASRLSSLLWLSLPDDELLRLAGAGRLRGELRPQVERMLADPRSARFFEDFPGQWLRTRNILMTPVSTKAAGRLDPVRASMKRETELLFEHVARNDRDLIELLTADYSFLDKPLADFYGIPGVPAEGVHKVALPPESRRGGLLGHGSFLVSTSNPNRTSPVKRGLFVLENLLAVEPPPPPPDIPALDDVNLGDTSKKTGRELLALHRADRSCAACHAHFDPIGIALERFDLIGRWRDTEDGRPIDAAERAVTGERLAGLEDVRALLARDKARFYQGVSEKLLTYALGRGLEPADLVTVEAVARRVEKEGGTFRALLLGVVESRPFQMRRGGESGAVSASGRPLIPATPPPDKRRPPKRSAPKEPVPAENVFPPDDPKPKEAKP